VCVGVWMCVHVIYNDSWQLKAIDRQFGIGASVSLYPTFEGPAASWARLVCGSCGIHSHSYWYSYSYSLFTIYTLFGFIHCECIWRIISPSMCVYLSNCLSVCLLCPIGPISIDDFIAITRTKYFSAIHLLFTS